MEIGTWGNAVHYYVVVHCMESPQKEVGRAVLQLSKL